MTSNPTNKQVIVIGGGLAGMTAALRLQQLGCDVTLYESDDRLGGKAGSIKVTDDYYADHGYHLFPAFYLNTWNLVDELGIRDNFINTIGYRNRFKNKKGYQVIIPPILFLYSLIDLVSRTDKEVQGFTIRGFIESRYYSTPRVVQEYSNMVLKALSDPTYRISALTVKNMYALWLRYFKPPSVSMHSDDSGKTSNPLAGFTVTAILKNSLQQMFIFPIRDALAKAGVTVKLNHQLTDLEFDNGSKKVAKLSFTSSGAETQVDTTDQTVIMAIPVNNIQELLKEIPFETETQEFFDFEYLRTNQMMGIDIHLNRKLTDKELPRQHIVLVDSKYNSTILDISKIWVKDDGSPMFDHSVIQVVSADTTPIVDLSEDQMRDELLKDIAKYGIFSMDDVDMDKTVFQPNFTSPLFMNDVGSHQYRASAESPFNNLFFGGDWCNSIVDVASMENAVTTGSYAAEAARKYMGVSGKVPIADPDLRPRWMWVALRLVLTPVAIILKLVDMVLGIFRR